MRTKKNHLLKKTITLGSSLILLSGACLGMGFGIQNLTTNIQKSSDFDSGHSLQLNLRLYQVDALGAPLKVNNELVPVYADKDEELKNLKITAEAVTKILQDKKLTNIQVSFGYSTAANSLFPNNIENIAVLYTSFENSVTAFSLNDITEEVNTYINNEKIFKTLVRTYNYELENVQANYNYSGGFVSPITASTQRNNAGVGELGSQGGIFYNEKSQNASGMYFYLQDGNQTSKVIKPYTGEDFTGSNVLVSSKENLNSWAFVTQKNAYDTLVPESETATTSLKQVISNYYQEEYDWGVETQAIETATDQEKFQTKNSWILWKDKQGLINYLNRLIMLWYYNSYANIVPSITNPTREDFDRIFNTTVFNYENYVVPEIRDQINLVINALTETEKALICMLGSLSNSNNPISWEPKLVTEQDIIPILYSYYNSKTWNANYVNLQEETAVPSYGYSTSVINGWGWLESNNASSINSIAGDYLGAIIDYRNYTTYFTDPDKDDKTTDEAAISPFTTKEFVLPTQDSLTPQQFSDLLNTSNKFSFIMPQYSEFVQAYKMTVKTQLQELRDTTGIDFNDPENPETIKYKEKRAALANKYFTSTNLFNAQHSTKPILVDSWVNYNSLYILLIIISGMIFMIGIFISVRYRIPGFVAFISTAFVFITSAYLYNVFGFVFSFNTVIALLLSSFLSLLSPIFLLRNITKEVKEHSSLNAAVIKSVKKYWKMSLDVHVIALLSSLSFLFFGIGGNINFGSMLVISVFLSFILSGVIYFILMLFYTQYFQFANSHWFFSQRLYQYYVDFSTANAQPKAKLSFDWLSRITSHLTIFGKTNYFSVIVFSVIALVGMIVLGVVGPGDSLDFKQTNILVIYNFADLKLTANEIIQALKINPINAFVYENTFMVYTESSLLLSTVINDLSQTFPALDTGLLTNNLLTTTLTTSVALQNVNNTLMCFGIAIGFCAVWTMLSLNIVSVLPMAIIQTFNLMFIFGFFSIVRLPMDLPVLAIATFIFVISSAISSSCLSCVKSSWNRKTLTKQHELKLLVTSIVKKINANYLFLLFCFGAFSILAMIFASPSLIFVFLLLLLALIWIGYFNNVLLMIIWFYCVLLRDLFNKELQKTNKQEVIRPDYDAVNEQIITGINN